MSVSQNDRFSISLLAKGTPLDGVGPVVRLVVDNRVLGVAKVVGDQLGIQSWTVPLAAGTHKIVIRFVNDAYSKTQDRNLFVSQLSIGSQSGLASLRVATQKAWLASRASGT